MNNPRHDAAPGGGPGAAATSYDDGSDTPIVPQVGDTGSGEIIHPYADRFPMLPDDELDALAADIKANGLQNPTQLTRSGYSPSPARVTT